MAARGESSCEQSIYINTQNYTLLSNKLTRGTTYYKPKPEMSNKNWMLRRTRTITTIRKKQKGHLGGWDLPGEVNNIFEKSFCQEA